MPRCRTCNMHCGDTLSARNHCDTKAKAKANLALAHSKNIPRLIKLRNKR